MTGQGVELPEAFDTAVLPFGFEHPRRGPTQPHRARHPDGDAVLCVLSEHPLDVDVDRYRVWREFLRPVLTPGYPGELRSCPKYLKKVLANALNRHVWLFEGAPTPRLPGILLKGAESRGDSVELVWADMPGDPDQPTCFLYTGPSFDRDLHLELVEAIVNAWRVTGQAGRLFGADGELHFVSGVSWDKDEDGESVLAWQFDPGTCEIVAVMERLAAALGALAHLLQEGSDNPYFERLLVS